MSRNKWINTVLGYLDKDLEDLSDRQRRDLETLYEEGWTSESAAGITKLSWKFDERKTTAH